MNPRPSRRWPFGLLIVLGLLAALVGCGSDRPDEHYYAAAVCVDQDGVRVPDNYCPIGDGIDNQGFAWNYRPYRDTDHDIDVVYVGYPVDRTVWVHDRPRRVPTINIDRGRYLERPATVAAAGTTSARVVTIADERKVAASGSSTTTRGGLGVSRSARNAEAPQPNRSLDSKAPGRAGEAKPRPLPKAPTTRVVAKSTKSTKSGSK
jgi:hypothetical protein